MQATLSRLVFRIAQVSASVVVGGWLLLATFYFRARVELGHWPRKNLDDPGWFFPGLHYEIAGYGFYAALWATAALIVLALIALFDHKSAWPTIKLTLVALAAYLAFQGNMGTWYLD